MPVGARTAATAQANGIKMHCETPLPSSRHCSPAPLSGLAVADALPAFVAREPNSLNLIGRCRRCAGLHNARQ